MYYSWQEAMFEFVLAVSIPLPEAAVFEFVLAVSIPLPEAAAVLLA
jgi:hypothetical protein